MKKSYRTFVGQNIPAGTPGWSTNLYGRDMMPWVAFSTLRGTIHMGQGDTKQEALDDLALRMLGHDEQSWRLKVIEG